MNNTSTGESFTPTIEQYFMAAAIPPKIIFNPVREKYLRASNAFIPPAYKSDEYKRMIADLAKAEADYRLQFAKTMIEKLGNGTEK